MQITYPGDLAIKRMHNSVIASNPLHAKLL